MGVYFTSDTHFNHNNIIKYCHRPFLSDKDKEELEKCGVWHNGSWKGEGSSNWRITPEGVKMMDDTLINNINAIVGAKDILWHLGDFAFGKDEDYYRICRSYRDRINCQNINIIWGNHDRPNKIRSLFDEAWDLEKIKVSGLNNQIILCHYALAVWDGSHRGNWHLYGHSHAGAEAWLDANMPGRRSLDVGVDNAYKLLGEFRPFSVADLQKIFNGRQGFSMDHHIPRNSKAPTEEEIQRGGLPPREEMYELLKKRSEELKSKIE